MFEYVFSSQCITTITSYTIDPALAHRQDKIANLK